MIELMITITVVAILSAIAAPSFRDLIAAQRIKTASYDIFNTLTFARSEAIKRNANVTVAQASGGWQNGWTVTVGATTLTQQEAVSGVILTGSASSLVYGGDGRVNASQTFGISSSVSSSVSGRCVSIELSGLPKSKVGTCS